MAGIVTTEWSGKASLMTSPPNLNICELHRYVWGKEEVGRTVCAEALSMVLASTYIHVLNRKGDPSEAVQPLGPSLDKQMPELQFSLAPSARGFLFSGQPAQT